MYQFYSQILVRTPVYTGEDYMPSCLQRFLRDPYFIAAIYVGSCGLYQELEKKGFNAELLSPRVRLTLQKYLNRMCFRPTPFGLFSGISLANWTPEKGQPLVIRSNGFRVHTNFSFGEGLKIANALCHNELAPYHTYRRNDSLYRIQDEIRYLRFEQDRERGTRNFFVDSLGYQGFLYSLLQFCNTARSKAELLEFIRERTGASGEDSACFLEQLVEQQALFSSLEPNISGQDYLHRLLSNCLLRNIHTPRVRALETMLQTFEAIACGTKQIGDMITEPDPMTSLTGGKNGSFYVNLEKGHVSGGLDMALQKALLEGINCLNRLLPAQSPPGLQHFVSAFKKKFNDRALPLLWALDPEIGVGYEELAANYSAPVLLQGMEFPVKEKSPVLEWSPAHALLLDKWSKRKGTTAPLELEEVDLAQLPGQEEPVSPSISVLFRVLNDQVLIEQAGGASATALLGRFTSLQGDIHRMARAIARLEEAANPGVIFAEIAHVSDEHTANIDRRCVIREYEIPVLVQAGSAAEQQVPLDDLWIKVVEGQVILFSQKHLKVVVPRLSSAYNYKRNDLSVFRFLCDLQFQGIRTNFTLDLGSFFPGLSYYPRVVYKNTILSLASWRIRQEQLTPILAAPGRQKVRLIKALAADLGWPRRIALTEHDRQVVIDLEQEGDLVLFQQTLNGKQEIEVKEFPFLDQPGPVVTEGGVPYVHQFLAALYHSREIYPPVEMKAKTCKPGTEIKRKFLPGSEWLYVKVYCHPSRANQLLTETLLPLVRQLSRGGKVNKWFFIRYREDGYHLRVRLAVSPEHCGSVLWSLQRKLAGAVGKGVVQDLVVAVYERELERYGPKLIAAVEDVFCASSALVSASINKLAPDETDYLYYREAFNGLSVIVDVFGLGQEAKVELFQQLYEGFYREMNGNKILRTQLSRKFRALSGIPGLLPPIKAGKADGLAGLQEKHRDALQRLVRQVRVHAAGKTEQLLADLMHMHLNRLFVDDSRKQELVTYYCLWRYYTSLLARKG